MAQIKNTLTRFHKIAERIAQKRQQVQEAILKGVTPVALDASVLAVRGAGLETEANFAVDESLAQFDRLSHAYFKVRNALAVANVENDVAKTLASQEQAKRRISLLTSILESQSNAMAQKEAQAIFTARSTEEAPVRRGLYDSLTVTFLSEERLLHVRSELTLAELSLAKLGDKLADLNARQLTVEIDDRTATELGLV